MISEINQQNDTYIPQITWFQTLNKVYLTIHEFNINPPKIEIFFKKMTCKTETKDNKKKIKFDIDFFSDIYKEIKIDNYGRLLRLIISKKEHQYWPRLYREKESFSWISCDAINFEEEECDDKIIDEYNYQVNEFDTEINKDVLNQVIDSIIKNNLNNFVNSSKSYSNSIFSKQVSNHNIDVCSSSKAKITIDESKVNNFSRYNNSCSQEDQKNKSISNTSNNKSSNDDDKIRKESNLTEISNLSQKNINENSKNEKLEVLVIESNEEENSKKEVENNKSINKTTDITSNEARLYTETTNTISKSQFNIDNELDKINEINNKVKIPILKKLF